MVEAAGTPILHSVSTPLPGSVATLLSNRGGRVREWFPCQLLSLLRQLDVCEPIQMKPRTLQNSAAAIQDDTGLFRP